MIIPSNCSIPGLTSTTTTKCEKGAGKSLQLCPGTDVSLNTRKKHPKVFLIYADGPQSLAVWQKQASRRNWNPKKTKPQKVNFPSKPFKKLQVKLSCPWTFACKLLWIRVTLHNTSCLKMYKILYRNLQTVHSTSRLKNVQNIIYIIYLLHFEFPRKIYISLSK